MTIPESEKNVNARRQDSETPEAKAPPFPFNAMAESKNEDHDKQKKPPLAMPGPPEVVAQEIEAISVEGRPGDPKSAPRMLWREITIGMVLVVILSLGLGLIFEPAIGVVALIFGTLGLLLNPVVSAASSRANERQRVLETHPEADSDPTERVVVVHTRTTTTGNIPPPSQTPLVDERESQNQF